MRRGRGRSAAVTPAGAPTPRVTACPPPKERDSGTLLQGMFLFID